MVALPRLVIAAPSSGAGKTTVATGLMAALSARGRTVSPHKVGPDYLDPTWHTVATGRPGRNLDAFLCGPQRMAPLLLHGASGADVAVIEGVMGLFDGAASPPEDAEADYASTAHVARLVDAPVVLVIDAAKQSRSVAALVHGFATYDPRVGIGGVIFNRVGSDRHEALLREALTGLSVPVLGSLRRDDTAALSARHLGLVPAGEQRERRAAVERLGALVARAVDLDAIMALARSAPPVRGEPWQPRPVESDTGVRVGVLTGPAFGFVYPENLELLEAAGAEVVPVLQHDEGLPDLDALYLPGGFPEVYAAELAANAALRAAVRRFADAGGAVLAECGGLLYLAETLDGHPMCGVLPIRGRMTDRARLGYRTATVATRSLLGEPGEVVRAHEFHYSRVDGGSTTPAWRVGDEPEGHIAGNVVATYLHPHWAGAPAIARRLARRVAATRRHA